MEPEAPPKRPRIVVRKDLALLKEEQEIAQRKKNTEQIGLTLEYAICLMMDTPFQGHYRYSVESARELVPHLLPFRHHFEHCKHTGRTSREFDFTNIHTGEGISVKSNEKSYRVCPQVVGQPTERRFKEVFGFSADATKETIKAEILADPIRFLRSYWHHTFHCPVLFYDCVESRVYWIQPFSEPEWNQEDVSFSKTLTEWRESNTLRVNDLTLGEFQIHTHRSCIKFRWNFKQILTTFAHHFRIEQTTF